MGEVKGGSRERGDFFKRFIDPFSAKPDQHSDEYGRVDLPGEKKLQLPAGTVRIYRIVDRDDPAKSGNDSGSITLWNVKVTVTAPSGADVPCRYIVTGSANSQTKHRVVEYIARFDVTEPGEHTVLAEAQEGAPYQWIYLGLGR